MSNRIADTIAGFAGSMRFFYVNGLVFAAWIAVNLFTPWRFDAYPFGLLTLCLSIEAIFLTIFVLIAQNRQAEQDRNMVKQDARTNQEAEQEIRLLMQQLDRIEQLLLRKEHV